MKTRAPVNQIMDAAWDAAKAVLGPQFNTLEGRSFVAYALLVAARGMLMRGRVEDHVFEKDVWDVARESARHTLTLGRNKRQLIMDLAEWREVLEGEDRAAE